MITWITKLIDSLTSPVADLVGGWSERKRIAAESAAKIAEAQVNLKLAKLDAKAKRIEREAEQDFDYDAQVLKNRESSLIDEFIIAVWFLVFLLHFIPAAQPFMAGGWVAMGYGDEPAWWFEFGMVGILVSTLGLMRLLRLLLNRNDEKPPRIAMKTGIDTHAPDVK